MDRFPIDPKAPTLNVLRQHRYHVSADPIGRAAFPETHIHIVHLGDIVDDYRIDGGKIQW